MTETKLRVHAEVEAKQRRDLFRAGQRLHRMLGPWTETEEGWSRNDVTGSRRAVLVRYYGKVELFESRLPFLTFPRMMYSDLLEAKAAADKALTEAGWELVD
jgi:hypothetical protein